MSFIQFILSTNFHYSNLSFCMFEASNGTKLKMTYVELKNLLFEMRCEKFKKLHWFPTCD